MLLRLTRWLEGRVSIRIRGSTIERFLNACAREGVALHAVRRTDLTELTAEVSVRDCRRLRSVMRRSGCRLRLTGRRGAPFLMARFLRRRVLVVGAGLFGVLWLVLGSFLWVIDYRIDPGLPREAIILRARELGIYTGSPLWKLDLFQVRDRLICSFDQLGTVQLRRAGNAIEVEIHARDPMPPMVDYTAITGVVASRPGLITDMDVTGGEARVKVGDTVTKGQLLISALVHPRTEEAAPFLSHGSGRITAQTWYDDTVRAPSVRHRKVYTGRTCTRFALIFGNHRVNLYFGCGITGDTCDKIIEKTELGLSPTVRLPIWIVRERFRFYETEVCAADPQTAAAVLAERAEAALAQSIDGTVEEFRSEPVETGAGIVCHAVCREQIGVEMIDFTPLPPPKVESPS